MLIIIRRLFNKLYKPDYSNKTTLSKRLIMSQNGCNEPVV